MEINPPVILSGDELVNMNLDLLASIPHIHNIKGVCLKNRHGKRCDTVSNSNDGQVFVETNLPDRHPSTQNCVKWLVPSPGVRNQDNKAAIVGMKMFEITGDILALIEEDSPELTAGLRKLLEAKDCFVRAALDEVPGFWTDR